MSSVGLVPVMALADQAGLSELVDGRVRLGRTRVASAGVNPAGKVASMIAGMAAGADSIEDLQMIRSGGMKRLFAGCAHRPRWASSSASSATVTPCNWRRRRRRTW